jgi:hypothetical protein
MTPGFAWVSGYRLTPVQPLTGGTTLLRHPIACLLPDRVPRSPHNGSRRNRKGFGWSASPASARAHCHGHGNINPLSIDYACRPRLRSRLTLGGLTWPRNPWSFGGRVSHSAFATHACILTRTPSTTRSLGGFTGCTTLPYPSQRLHPHPTTGPGADQCRNATASAVRLSPATLSAQDHLTSELLRTLSRVAASKPTSWLSGRSHILSHLAHA